MLHLENQRFGRLLVLSRSDQKDTQGRCYLWRCRCDCGKEAFVSGTQLKSGLIRSCGCLQTESRLVDVAGQTYGRLKAIAPTGVICQHSAVWRCECNCGNTVNVTLKSLIWGNKQSCGCLARETKAKHAIAMQKNCGRVDGTCLASIRSKKLPANNSTGVKGVSWHQGTRMYAARIQFQGKIHHLGYARSIEEAAALRKQAEDKLYAPYLEK